MRRPQPHRVSKCQSQFEWPSPTCPLAPDQTRSGNPYFLLWWATVGATLISRSARFGMPGFLSLALLRWLCDFLLVFAVVAVIQGQEVSGKGLSEGRDGHFRSASPVFQREVHSRCRRRALGPAISRWTAIRHPLSWPRVSRVLASPTPNPGTPEGRRPLVKRGLLCYNSPSRRRSLPIRESASRS